MDTLVLLKLLLLLAMLGYSIYSLIQYQSRRRASKQALQGLAQTDVPLREATAEELALIQPFLTQPGKKKRQLSLTDNKIHRLQGEYIRHGLTSNQGADQMHDTLGGVEVILPYDAMDFLQEVNDAEVMLADKIAIVVRLNGEFDLEGGRERALRRQEQSQLWESGAIGAVPDIELPSPEAAATPDDEEILRVDMLGQRDETPGETLARTEPGLGFLPAFLLILAAVSAAVGTAQEGEVGIGLSAVAGLLLLCALWLIWRPRRTEAAKRVNHVRGALTAVELRNPNNAASVSHHWFLGDKFNLVMPKHWQPHVVVPANGRVDADLRVDDFSVVRLGKHFSIDAETRAFPRVYWGRHLVLAIAALLAGIMVIIMSGGGLVGDVLQTKAWLTGSPMQTYDSVQALRETTLPLGSTVKLQGQARCSLLDDGARMPVVDCTTLRWGGDVLAAPELTGDEQAFAFYSGSFLRTRSNPLLDMMVQQQTMRSMSDPLAYAYQLQGRNRQRFYNVIGLSETIKAIESYCQSLDAAGQANCMTLRQGVVENLLMDEDITTWKALVEAVEQGKVGTRRAAAVMSSTGVSKVKRLAQDLVTVQVEDRVAASAKATLQGQRGGVVLEVRPGEKTALPALPTFHQRDTVAGMAPADEFDALQRYRQYAWVASEEGVSPFSVEGMVVGVSHEDDGTPVYTLDGHRDASDLVPAAVRSIWWLLAWVLLVVHGVLAIVMFVRSRVRARKVNAYAAECAQAAARDINFI